ncbi:MarR family transcriptional regulator [Nocardia asteroides NBRC 15531]|uniref:MarR family transcriptional regulator n=1 Tax=Nocardia asteroides NBRC 15531 TaxID=1110697 RepID=U5E4N7_NOCAS|nr:MarR family transcriptional regulator [Nocardia asteroides]TLF70419.1 MarR family transcriptional regulator [Nocardia asteroides NBRC 15531]UGT49961.1 MarR family transcriptional regulator [Nocardia asteroides]SFN24136.1 DNA-binding transcriptional regulator, MarR family [Nocardia asteroides]VEG37279.1 transcriptional repressor MprA [Nocardia asteroides]GAD81660.1 putative MarR family transcriptional regulator [Nocardia asteroides NBRC 15531]
MDEPRWLDAAEMRLWVRFLAAGALVDRAVDQHLKGEGLTHTQYEVLVRLAEAPEATMRMTDLAAALYTSKSGLTYQVGKLEEAGLVRRVDADTDVRGVNAVLTAAGRATLAAVAPGHVEVVRRVFVDVLEPDQRAAISAGLGAVADRLTR